MEGIKRSEKALERIGEKTLLNNIRRSYILLGSLLKFKNSIQEEIKFRLKAGNSCYCTVQTFLSSRHLSKNVRIKIYKTILLPVVLYYCET